MAAAKEFNIGKDTLVDFLVSKGFNGDDLKPTAKLTEDMYRVLQSEFQQDKAAKQKAQHGKTKQQRMIDDNVPGDPSSKDVRKKMDDGRKSGAAQGSQAGKDRQE